MHARFLAVLAIQAASLTLGKPVSPRNDTDAAAQDFDQLDSLAQAAYQQAQADIQSADARKRGSGCTLSNIKVRREWGSLSRSQKLAYVNAVKCLQSKPAKTPDTLAPGAKTRFDDFVTTHINQTLTIHYTGNFLSWHRYYTWLYEEALQEECGYTGTQPYWNWALTARTGLANSPIFDGSDTSMSGNGEYIPGQADIVLGANSGLPPVYLPAGTGGGCVTSGPFRNMTVNLGPAALDVPGGVQVSNPNGPFAYNPRCLKRDLTDYVNQAFANVSAVLNLITQTTNVNDFQMAMQGIPGSGNIGVHGGGHYALGGDPGRDVYTSPGDPAFYLHHSMIDRVWWIWQMLDPANRVFSSNAVAGTNTFLNIPPSASTTLEDYVNFGYASGPPRQIKDLVNTLGGPFCYVYL